MAEKSCGAIIFRYIKGEVEFLLVKQKSMNWGFAKGHVEKGETEIETALREVKEETNLDVDILPYFKEQVYFFMRKTKKQVIFFLAKVKPDSANMKLQETEILDATWATYQESKQLLKFTNTKQMLEKAYIHILKNE